MKCPFCEKEMSPMDHGLCPNCENYCGCSFDPTSMNDYCEDHRPREQAKSGAEGSK